MASEEAEKTEAATPKRKDDARRKGQVAQSREVQSVALLGAALILLGSGLATHLGEQIVSLAASAWTSSPPQTLSDFHVAILHAGKLIAVPLITLMVLFALAGSAAAFAQTGPMLSFEALKPRGDRLNPLKGLKRLVDLDRAFDLLKALFKVTVVGSITWAIVSRSLDRLIGLSGVSLEAGLLEVGRLARDTALGSLLFLGVMAAVDLVYQRWRFETRLRMSKKEVRDELKDREGDPMLRNRSRAFQREASRSRMIAAVAQADVVVTNPTHYAVALQYTPGCAAPRVLAKGRNHVAQRIRDVARRNGVPIVENRPLARLLYRTGRVGQEIPEALFQAVAEVLAYVYRLSPARAERRSIAP